MYLHVNAEAMSTSYLLEDLPLILLNNPVNEKNPPAKDKSTYNHPLSYSENIQTIVIDPGHGGKDHGTSGKLSKEKDLALQVSMRIGNLIKEKYPQINIIYTRETDVFIPLHERAEIANNAHADLFVSVHCNFVPKKDHVQGTETYVMGLHRAAENLDIAMRENSVIFFEENYEETYGDYDPNSPENYIIQSMYQYAHLEHSIAFANYLEHEFVQSCNRQSRGVKQAGFLVLRRTTMPSVLVEIGFLSNESEEKYLVSEKGQDEIAGSFVNALDNYINYLNSTRTEQKIQAELIAEKVSKTVESQELVEAPTVSNIVIEGSETYAIQLFATSNEIPETHQIYSQFQDVTVKQGNGMYKYLCGSFKEADEARNQLNVVHTIGYKDAFITKIGN